MTIYQNTRLILEELPDGVLLVAAAKSRKPDEIREAVSAGIKIIGENYIQEAESSFQIFGHQVEWHFIGHLQKNKAKKAVALFDMVETIDSIEIAREIDMRCEQIGKIMPVLVEINSGREPQKSGVFPEDAESLIAAISKLKNICVAGLMTMGPPVSSPEKIRPYFSETKKLFNYIKTLGLPNVEMKFLSMGMTDSYQVALEEGANIVRIGTKIFGERTAI